MGSCACARARALAPCAVSDDRASEFSTVDDDVEYPFSADEALLLWLNKVGHVMNMESSVTRSVRAEALALRSEPCAPDALAASRTVSYRRGPQGGGGRLPCRGSDRLLRSRRAAATQLRAVSRSRRACTRTALRFADDAVCAGLAARSSSLHDRFHNAALVVQALPRVKVAPYLCAADLVRS